MRRIIWGEIFISPNQTDSLKKMSFCAENLSFLEKAAIIEQKNPKDVRESNERNYLLISITEYNDMIQA